MATADPPAMPCSLDQNELRRLLMDVFVYAETELDRYVDGRLKRSSWRDEYARHSAFDLQALLDIFTSNGPDQRRVLPDKDRDRDRYHLARSLASTCRGNRNSYAHLPIGRKVAAADVHDVANDFGRFLRALGWDASAKPLLNVCEELNRLRFSSSYGTETQDRVAAAEADRVVADQQRVEALAEAHARQAENAALTAEIASLKASQDEADPEAVAALERKISDREAELRALKKAQQEAQRRADYATAQLRTAEATRESAVLEAEARADEVARVRDQSEAALRHAAEQISLLTAERDALREKAEESDNAEAQAAANQAQDVVAEAIAAPTDRLAALEQAMARERDGSGTAGAPDSTVLAVPGQSAFRSSPAAGLSQPTATADPVHQSRDLRVMLRSLEDQLNRGAEVPGPASPVVRRAVPSQPIAAPGSLPNPGEKWPYEPGPFSYSLQPSVTDVRDYENDRYLSQVIGKAKAQAVTRRLLRYRPEGGTIRVDSDGDVSTQRKTGGGRFYLGRVSADEWFGGVVQPPAPTLPVPRTPSPQTVTQTGSLPKPGEKWRYEPGPFSYSLQPSVTDVRDYENDRYLSQVIGKAKAQAVARRLLRYRPEGGTIRVDSDGDVSTQRKTGGGRFYLGRVSADEWFDGVVES